jgi:cell division protein FtsB
MPCVGSALPARRERPARGTGFAAQDFFWIALAGSIAGFVLLVFRPNRDRIRAAEAECRLLRQEITALESKVTRLRSWERSLAAGDAEAWGAVARSRAGWVGPGERVMRPPDAERRTDVGRGRVRRVAVRGRRGRTEQQ